MVFHECVRGGGGGGGGERSYNEVSTLPKSCITAVTAVHLHVRISSSDYTNLNL